VSTRRVPAGGVVVVLGQAEMLRLMAEGSTRGDASDAAFEAFRALTMMTVGADVEAPAHKVGTPARCLAASAGGVRDALAAPWDAFARRHGDHAPSVMLDASDITRLIWLADAVRRIADGVDLLDAVRQAVDKAEGRPRQRRAPVDRHWLCTQISQARETVWWALREQHSFGRPLAPGPPEATIAERW
jgi:hypothetical protein